MAESTVKIYKNCKIVPDKNFVVEDINTYLSTLSTITINNFQYQKHAINKEIKVDTDSINVTTTTEDILDEFSSDSYNYISIQNSTESSPTYYFVINRTWTSHKTIKFILLKDTANCFNYGTDYQLDAKTEVIREHKDRFYNSYYESGTQKYYRRKVDFLSEGIQPIQYHDYDGIEENVTDDVVDCDWYLMYKSYHKSDSSDAPEACVCYIVPGRSFTFSVPTSSLSTSSLTANYIYIFGAGFSGYTGLVHTGSFYMPDDNNTTFEYDISSESYLTLTKTITSGQIKLTLAKIKQSSTYGYLNTETIKSYTSTTDFNISFSEGNNLFINTQTKYSTNLNGDYAGFAGRVNSNNDGKLSFTSSTASVVLDDISSVDKTDETIQKIIKLPYAPFDYVILDTGDLYVYNGAITRTAVEWTRITGFNASGDPITETDVRYYLRLSSNYQGYLTHNIENNTEPYFNLFYNIESTDTRDDNAESKLYHSDYYTEKLAYDSFNYPIRYENLSYYQLTQLNPFSTLDVDFTVTRTLNSNMLFKINNAKQGTLNTEPYPYLLTANRNNEITIYNDNYITYLKNGYNYDKKNKELATLSAVSSIVGGTLSGISGAYSTAASIYGKSRMNYWLNTPDETGRTPSYSEVLSGATPMSSFGRSAISSLNSPLSTLYGVGQVSSAISGIASGITGIIQAEASFDQKQKQQAAQGASVNGVDDVDLMSYYCDNRLKLQTYVCSDIMKERLADLFYYCGYTSQDRKTPVINTRKWFNYLQCNAIVNNLKNIPQTDIDDLKNRFATGITFLHNVNNNWDFSQTTANNETWLNI